MRRNHLLVALLAAAATLGASWATGFLNRHPRLENIYDRELVRLRAFGLPCGVERWPVKTLADTAAAQVNGDQVYTNIAKLDALPSDQPSGREAPTETTIWQLTRTHVIAFKLEGDSDIHLVLRSSLPGNPTMIAEIPDPGCITANTDPAAAGLQADVKRARAAFMAYITAHGLQLQTFFQTVDWTVLLRGVGFFDLPHGQTGVAPNAIELHPVTLFKGE